MASGCRRVPVVARDAFREEADGVAPHLVPATVHFPAARPGLLFKCHLCSLLRAQLGGHCCLPRPRALRPGGPPQRRGDVHEHQPGPRVLEGCKVPHVPLV